MAEEPRFQRRGQFGYIVEHWHASFLARWKTDVVENEQIKRLIDRAAPRVEHERAESDVGMKLTERTIKHARLRQVIAGNNGTSLESHCGRLVIHGSNAIGMTNLNFATR